ncbi:uncharacterized protein PV09_06642 [Verruconis gallopava]|uniref:Cytochrome b561 domain-containing protein n=1 Tax=Verruconis gallopava TaxID=253628 RepID=A0A0D2A5Z6_9PEZI|nr:uncharacterized protein PV09_06642 [Verruconis gallopava]KIW02158.1 hypothetical protein PV09_06642 [Verruconis gallopava]
MFDFETLNRARIAHGVLMSLAVFLFSIGAVLLRLLKGPVNVKVHIVLQSFGVTILIGGFGLGLWVQEGMFIEWSDFHQRLGLALFTLTMCMPLAGAFSHWHFRRNGRKTIVGYLHVWIGRVLIITNLINGGLGLRLAEANHAGEIVYAALTVTVALSYFCMLAWWYFWRGRTCKLVHGNALGGVELVQAGIENN